MGESVVVALVGAGVVVVEDVEVVVVDEEVVTGGAIVEGTVDSVSMCCSGATVVEITSMGGSDVICYSSKR